MEMTLKRNIPQNKVPRDISLIPINIVDPSILTAFNNSDIMMSSVYYSQDRKGNIEVWHGNGDGTWDCVILSL